MSADAGIFFQGWMHKKNDNKFIGDKWNKRWFVLYEDGILAYYATQVLEDKKNSVNLRGSKLHVLPKEHLNKKRPWCFELETKERTFLLSCMHEKDFRSWIYWLSKEHPDAPLERTGTFNTVINEVLHSAEVQQNRRQSLTSRVKASVNFLRGREKSHSTVETKLSEQHGSQNSDVDNDSVDKRRSSPSLPSLDHRVSRPMFHVENKEDGESLPPPESDFAKRLQEFVRENEQKMEEVINKLSRTFSESELKVEN